MNRRLNVELLKLARVIAADRSKQTGKNRANFISGRYDHAYGVRTAMDALKLGIQLGRATNGTS